MGTLTTKDKERWIAKIAGIAKEPKLEIQILSPQRTQRNTEEIRKARWAANERESVIEGQFDQNKR